MSSNSDISCCYILANTNTSQLKIGASKCLTRRLWEHETGLEGFELQFFVPHAHPFVLEKFLHRFVAENDLIIEICQKREVYKCDLNDALEQLKNFIINRRKLVWFTTVYANNKTAVLLNQPVRRDFNRHVWEGSLEIKSAFEEYVKPEYWKTYYENHKDTIKERAKNYYHENKAVLLPRMKERYFRLRGVGQTNEQQVNQLESE